VAVNESDHSSLIFGDSPQNKTYVQIDFAPDLLNISMQFEKQGTGIAQLLKIIEVLSK
jgi:hypothetical protein